MVHLIVLMILLVLLVWHLANILNNLRFLDILFVEEVLCYFSHVIIVISFD
jgi:hypothetical protein